MALEDRSVGMSPPLLHPADFMDVWIRDHITNWQYNGDVKAIAQVKAAECLRDAAAQGITAAMIKEDMAGLDAYTLIHDAMTHRPEVEIADAQLRHMKLTRH